MNKVSLVKKAFVGCMCLCDVRKKTEGEYVDGEWIAGSLVEETALMVPRPISPQDVRRLPEGKYLSGSMKFYATDLSIGLRPGDVIIYKNIEYEVGDIWDREEFLVYIGKRLYEQG